MANWLAGEYDINLNGMDYHLILNSNVIASYESETGRCFIADAYKAVDAAVDAEPFRDRPSRYASIMCQAVTRNQAAILVCLAAKESNSQVELGEIEEAFLVDHALEDARFHPAIFTTLALFAIQGKKVKKKDNSDDG